MNTRMLILKITATIAALICGGCQLQSLPSLPVAPTPQTKPAEPQTINLKITVDGSGKINVAGGADVTVKHAITSPLDTEPIMTEPIVDAGELPEIWAFSCRDSCPKAVKDAVDAAKKELAAAKDLPFKVIWKDLWEPCVSGSPPAFWFHVSADQPTCRDVSNTRVQNGWKGLKHLIETWKHNRETPTPKSLPQSMRAGGPVTGRPFVRPDQHASQATANSSMSYHRGHDCPSCGRLQYTIANGAGPNHTHICGSCGTVWYHRDQ